MKNLLLRHFVLLAVLLFSAHLGWSQGATTAAMSGVISDKTGTGLPGATVIAVHTPTNTQYVTPTNSEGRFNIQNMRVGGPYTVKVTYVGYKDLVRDGLNLSLGQNLRFDQKLSDASTELNEVTVSGRRDPVMNADHTGAQTTVQRETIERLPTLNRSFADFTRLTPQASAGGGFAGRSNGFNNITIDGAVFNNSFGLSGNIGGQANAQPISLDAVDQIQVSIAPFDVRQGSFTGASINAITRSGSNKISASIYGFYRDQSFLGKDVGDVNNPLANFNLKNFGFRVGGPIIKDKLFFFLNAERELREEPPFGNYSAFRGTNGPTVSSASGTDLDVLSNFLTSKYNYNPGPYEGYKLAQNSDKITAKLDWNISANHRFNIKYNYLKSLRDVSPSNSGSIGSRSQTLFGLPYYGAYYRINNNLNSIIAELNSTLGAKYSNNLTAGFLAGRDFRQSTLGSEIPLFPLVDIGNATGLSAANSRVNAPQTLTSFGYEPFSAFNKLDTDTYQFGDNFTAYLGKHNVTLGTYNEINKFTNGFAPQYYGAYVFNSLQDFYASAATDDSPYGYNYGSGVLTPRTQAQGLLPAQRYQLRYSALPGGSFPFAVTNTAQLGLYLQDEWSPKQNLKVTYGLRGDLPIIYSDIQQNADLAKLTNFRENTQINTSQLPKRTVLFSPRAGFNWDVNDDRKTQLRGGSGIFTGRVPFVWISNQASNNGVQFGSIDVQGAAAAPYAFNPSVDKYRTFTGANTQYNVAVTDREFKFPQVWRSNLAFDQELPGGVIATLEALYTKDINSIYHQNVNLPNSTVRATGADNRPIFYTPNASGVLTVNNRIYGPLPAPSPNPNGLPNGNSAAQPNITDAILMRNSNKGYSYSVTGQLQKSFSGGFYAMAAYTYSDSRSVNDGGSIAQSIWAGRQVSGDPNADVTSYSSYLLQHRVIGSLSYRKEYLGHLGTTISLFYEGAPAGRYSYTYGSDMNGDGVSGNDLMYIPRNSSEVALVNRTFFTGTPDQYVYTAAQQALDLETFISQDSYLSKHRGEYAERNGAVQPWQHRVDLKLLQDVFTDLGTNRNSLQVSLDIFNVGNLLNKNWGIYQFAYTSSPLAFQGYNAQGQPTFQFQYATLPTRTVTTTPGPPPVSTTVLTTAQALNTTFRNDVTSIASRWQLQIGLRYIFN